MTFIIENYQVYLGLMINGIFTGLGVAIGTWIANKKVIERIDRLEMRVKRDEQNNTTHGYCHYCLDILKEKEGLRI